MLLPEWHDLDKRMTNKNGCWRLLLPEALELQAASASVATLRAFLSALPSGATVGSGLQTTPPARLMTYSHSLALLDRELASRNDCSSLGPRMLTLNFKH